jgi:PAS domain S-box-containing protein
VQKITTYFILSFLLFTVSYALGQASSKKILVIYSYDATFHIYQKSVKALHDVFPQSDNIIDIEFLDSKRYPNRQLNTSTYEQIQIKQKEHRNYDIVIACNDNAFEFCLEYQTTLFPEIPIVFWGVNDLEKAFDQDQNEWVTGIAQNISLEKTLRLVQKLHPERNYLHMITDSTTTAIADFKVFEKAISLFPTLNYETINASNYTREEYRQKIQQIPSNQIIFLLASYRLKDDYLSLDQIAELLSTNSNSPIYYAYDIGVGSGYIAGTAICYYEQMYSACLIAKQILNGTPLQSIRVRLDVSSNSIVDYNLVKKFHINPELIPESAIVLNDPNREIEISTHEFYEISSVIVGVFVILSLAIFFINLKRKREKRYRIFAENYLNIFNENHSMMLLIDAKSQVIKNANKAAARFYGYSQTQLKGLNFSELCQLPQIDLDAFFTQSEKQNSHFEQKHLLKSGQIKDVEIHSGKINIDKGIYIYAIVHDISKRIKAEQELIDAKRRAEESDRLKSSFLANMSHEIRTPMNSILGFSSLLEVDDMELPTRKEYIRHINNSGEHLLTLINDIIDLSKIEANQLKIYKTNCKINFLMDDLQVMIKSQLERAGKDIQLKLDKGIKDNSFNIKTDEVRLKQILINLLSNAIKFTESGHIEFGYKYREDSVLQFFVKDSGIGIHPDKQKDIFSAFKQVEEYSSRTYGGNGLGLSITKSLVEKLGGHIWVMSEPGQGSRFYFTLPAENNQLEL